MSKSAADQVYQRANIKPNDVQVVELHGIYLPTFLYDLSVYLSSIYRLSIFYPSIRLSVYPSIRLFIYSSSLSITKQILIILVTSVSIIDCFSANELITYEALGLAEPGKGGQLVDQGIIIIIMPIKYQSINQSLSIYLFVSL